LLAAVWLLSSSWSKHRGSLPPDAELVVKIASVLVLLCFGLVTACGLAWVWTGRERWIIRGDILEIHRQCLGRTWRRSVIASELLIEPDDVEWFTGRRRRWRLTARGKGADQEISNGTLFGLEDLTALGAYLAARTGWRWHPPRDLPHLTSLLDPRGW